LAQTQSSRNLAETEAVLSEFCDLDQVKAPSRSTAPSYRFARRSCRCHGHLGTLPRKAYSGIAPSFNQQERQQSQDSFSANGDLLTGGEFKQIGKVSST